MPKARRIGSVIEIDCPGCGFSHSVRDNPNKKPCWTFNGDFEKPTFSPSLLVRSGHYVTGETPANCLYCKEGDEDLCYICHSFVKDGKIEFLTDSTHKFAGQTLELKDYK